MALRDGGSGTGTVTLPRARVRGTIHSVGYPYASTISPPFTHGPGLAPPLLWDLPGPLVLSGGEEGRAGLTPAGSVPAWS